MTGDCSHHHENLWKTDGFLKMKYIAGKHDLKFLRCQKSGNIMQSGKGDRKGYTTAKHGSPF